MSIGLAHPIQVNQAGGALVTTGSAQVSKILNLTFSEGGDKNPFQDLGLDLDIIFRLQSINAQQELLLQVKKIVRKFEEEGVLILAPDNPIQVLREVEGELELVIRWIDPENNDTLEFRRVFVR